MMNDFERRRQEKADRMRELAEKNRRKAEGLYDTARQMGEAIPFGQPILIGHHSEGRDRRYRAKIGAKYEKADEAQKKATYYAGRAAAIEDNKSIFSDDPQAGEKLTERIAILEKRRDLMRAANKCVRKKDLEGLMDLGFNERRATELMTVPDFCGRIGFADYELSNLGANIRRLKQRAQIVEARSKEETSEKELCGVRIVENCEDNRLQLFFPGKPSEKVRDHLKAMGFKWSHYNGAWQRHRSSSATWGGDDCARFYGKEMGGEGGAV